MHCLDIKLQLECLECMKSLRSQVANNRLDGNSGYLFLYEKPLSQVSQSSMCKAGNLSHATTLKIHFFTCITIVNVIYAFFYGKSNPFTVDLFRLSNVIFRCP